MVSLFVHPIDFFISCWEDVREYLDRRSGKVLTLKDSPKSKKKKKPLLVLIVEEYAEVLQRIGISSIIGCVVATLMKRANKTYSILLSSSFFSYEALHYYYDMKFKPQSKKDDEDDDNYFNSRLNDFSDIRSSLNDNVAAYRSKYEILAIGYPVVVGFLVGYFFGMVIAKPVK